MKQVQLEIGRRNRVFGRAERAKKRILICEDVIRQIQANQLSATRGSYCNPKSKVNASGGADLRTQLLAGNVPVCRVCAIGALMVAGTLYVNTSTVNDLLYDFRDGQDSDFVTKQLRKYFSSTQLHLIECSFEMWGADSITMSYRTAYKFGKRFEKNEDRLIAIMNNIIENNGTFKPQKGLVKQVA